MLSAFQEGRRPRANAVASLDATGYVSPLGRRPLGGVAQHAHRPGPHPLSARQAQAMNARNSAAKRAIDQVYAECAREVFHSNARVQQQAASLAFSRFDYDKRNNGRDAADTTIQLPGTYREVDATRYVAGGLWIYATSLGNYWGDHRYFVYNPQTGAMLEFAPESAIQDPRRRLYLSHQAQFQGLARGTGVAGGYLEKGFGALALGGFGAAVAVEAGGYYVLSEQVAPTVSCLAVQAWRVARPAIQAYAQRAAKGAAARMFIDAGFQFGTSYLAADPSRGGRGEQARNGINGTSVLAAGVVSVGEAKTLAKFLVAFGSAAATNLMTVSGSNLRDYKNYWHVTDFGNAHERVDYVRNVILSTLFDQGKEYGAEWVAKRAAGQAEEWAAQASGRASKAALKWVTETRVALPASVVLGGVPETLKKRWENKQAAQEEAEKAQQQKEAARRIIKPASSSSKY